MVTRTRPAPSTGAPKTARRGRRRDDSLFHSLRQVWNAVSRRVPELRRDIGQYASVQADRARLALRERAERAARAAVLALVGAALLVTATCLMLAGAAGGVAAAFDGRAWLGNLVVGGATLLLAFGGIALQRRQRSQRRLRALQAKYRLRERHDGRRHPAEVSPDVG